MVAPVFQLIDKVVALTNCRDSESIAACLIHAISELTGSAEVTFYCAAVEEELNEPSSLISTNSQIASRLSDMIEVLFSIASTPIPTSCESKPKVSKVGDDYHVFHVTSPVLAHEKPFLSCLLIKQSQIAAEKINYVKALLQVYENQIEILREWQTDKLTGLLNRHTFDGQLLNIIKAPFNEEPKNEFGFRRRVLDDSFSYWLAILDIDNFKHINDNYGHIYGDEILILLARLLKSGFRTNDFLFRYGGEEFVVLLKTPSQKDTFLALDRFRRTVGAYNFPNLKNVTVSIGFVHVLNEHLAPSEILENADRALYYAKRNGKNRVCNYEQLLTDGHLQEQKKHAGEVELF